MIHKPDLLISNHSTPALSFFISLGKYHQYVFGSLTFRRYICFHVVKFSITSTGSRDRSFLCISNWDILSHYFLQAIFANHNQLLWWKKREGKASTYRKATDIEMWPWSLVLPDVLQLWAEGVRWQLRRCKAAVVESLLRVSSLCSTPCKVLSLLITYHYLSNSPLSSPLPTATVAQMEKGEQIPSRPIPSQTWCSTQAQNCRCK